MNWPCVMTCCRALPLPTCQPSRQPKENAPLSRPPRTEPHRRSPLQEAVTRNAKNQIRSDEIGDTSILLNMSFRTPVKLARVFFRARVGGEESAPPSAGACDGLHLVIMGR